MANPKDALIRFDENQNQIGAFFLDIRLRKIPLRGRNGKASKMRATFNRCKIYGKSHITFSFRDHKKNHKRGGSKPELAKNKIK